MKTRILLVALLIALLSACQPAAPNFSGRWTTNAGTLTLTQTGNEVSGSFEGYGGNFVFTLGGDVSGTILSFDAVSKDLPALPDIVLSEDGQTFHSADSAQGFCGSRNEVLPDGCGFSGTWKLKADFIPEGSLAKLTQSGATVSGGAYGPDGVTLAAFDGVMDWGKGLHLTGTNEWGEYSLGMMSDGRSFFLMVDLSNQEWCGLRDGETSAYVLFFDCAIP